MHQVAQDESRIEKMDTQSAKIKAFEKTGCRFTEKCTGCVESVYSGEKSRCSPVWKAIS